MVGSCVCVDHGTTMANPLMSINPNFITNIRFNAEFEPHRNHQYIT